MTLKLGAHVSVAGGFINALHALDELNANCGAIFNHPPRSYKFSNVPESKIDEFRTAYEAGNYDPIVVHSTYLLNLATPDDKLYHASINTLLKEIQLADKLGLPYVNFHPGSHKGKGTEYGQERVVKGINKIKEAIEATNVTLLFENTAGKGNTIGATLEELHYLVENSNTKQVGVCLDTQHTFAAGYPIHEKQGLETFLKNFNKQIGLKHLHAIHLNDSMVEFNSHKDRHEHIGKGFIGKEGMKNLLNNETIKKHPLILETPMENGSHKNDMGRVRNLIEG